MKNQIDEIFETDNRTELIDKCADYIANEYKKAGDSIGKTDYDATVWALEGIYDREGEIGLKTYMSQWKPSIRKKKMRGYS